MSGFSRPHDPARPGGKCGCSVVLLGEVSPQDPCPVAAEAAPHVPHTRAAWRDCGEGRKVFPGTARLLRGVGAESTPTLSPRPPAPLPWSPEGITSTWEVERGASWVGQVEAQAPHCFCLLAGARDLSTPSLAPSSGGGQVQASAWGIHSKGLCWGGGPGFRGQGLRFSEQ